MKKSTKKQQKPSDTMQNILEEKFVEPQYLKIPVKFVTSEDEPDVIISQNHDVADFLAIGLAALYKEGGGTIKVFCDIFPSAKENDSISMPVNALYKNSKLAGRVLTKYFMDDNCQVQLFEMMLYMMVTTQVKGNTSPMFDLNFDDFFDIVKAQKLAFDTIQKALENYLI